MRAVFHEDADGPDRAVADVSDGATVLVGGFGLAGMPVALIDALIRQGAGDLTVVNNNAGNGDTGLAALLAKGRVRKVVCSFPRQHDSWVFDGLYRRGAIELELVPQGNLAERMRAAGAGIGAFFCPTGVGTPLAEGKETREIDGRTYVLEYPIRGDVALVGALRADRVGNLVYRKTARNFGPVMATAAETVVAQVREVVEIGGIDPEAVVTPGIYVDRVVSSRERCREHAQDHRRDRGRRRGRHPLGLLRQPGHRPAHHGGRPPRRASPAWCCTPRTACSAWARPRRPATSDPDLTNAGKQPVTELPGASYFHHADSFAMMRGGHLDVCVLGAFQVSTRGDLANWHTGAADAIPAVGGAMDLAIGAKRVFVMMTLFAKDGTPKLVPECTYPLTGLGCVTRVYTDLATFDLGPDGARLVATYGVEAGDLERRLGIDLGR